MRLLGTCANPQPEEEMAKVVLENVTKRFGKVIAVNNVSLQAEDKEFLVLLGPSGCGKTTTLRMIAGLELVDEGKVIIGDDVVNDVPPAARDIAMVFQNYALYPHCLLYTSDAADDLLCVDLGGRRIIKKKKKKIK